MENILQLEHVSKFFPRSGFQLEDVSFSLPYGSILGFVGENGAGKTSTIGCILGTLRRDSGTVKLFGNEMADADTNTREKSASSTMGATFRPIGPRSSFPM